LIRLEAIAMTATRRITFRLPGFVVACCAATVLLAGPAAARTLDGAEFERITADIRAATATHDMRAYHDFHVQLDRLIARSISR
jgi:hypothetical protein